ncbi:hypothetical protein [Corynebacterium occultum]|uniref:hypothetical protein n=1 Tax=Corynebacterium occultum TaxID=2675219 RepID=UPI0012E17D75|nr:hypothetical protein [Corynebacterium occultum]
MILSPSSPPAHRSGLRFNAFRKRPHIAAVTGRIGRILGVPAVHVDLELHPEAEKEERVLQCVPEVILHLRWSRLFPGGCEVEGIAGVEEGAGFMGQQIIDQTVPVNEQGHREILQLLIIEVDLPSHRHPAVREEK